MIVFTRTRPSDLILVFMIMFKITFLEGVSSERNSLKTLFYHNSTVTYIYPAKSGFLQSPSCVCLFVCLFVSKISHKLLVGFWWNLMSMEVMIIGTPSSRLGVIQIEIRIWDPDQCFSWTAGQILEIWDPDQCFS